LHGVSSPTLAKPVDKDAKARCRIAGDLHSDSGVDTMKISLEFVFIPQEEPLLTQRFFFYGFKRSRASFW